MDISPKLQMNLHPKDADNLSLVTALNVKVSNDESCITNEESIVENTFIREYLRNFYRDEEGAYHEFVIVGVIPCNVELVLICIDVNEPTKAQIFRYKEATSSQKQSMKCAYGNSSDKYLAYHNGKIKGTFTYNVENSLVIAIAEYDGDDEKIPFRTINLGNYDDTDIFSDKDCDDSMLSIAPEVRIPSMSNLKYLDGSAYKGWYYLFIRYKINSVDYTQWFNFGFPVFVDTLEQFAVTKYCYRQTINRLKITEAWKLMHPNQDASVWDIILAQNAIDGYCSGASDYFSNNTDIANETFSVDLRFPKNNYDKYQIGVICASKSYTKAFRTADININKSNFAIYDTFALHIKTMIEASAEEFIVDNYNYFDVRNVINYKNKLYISNYKENNANDDYIVNSGILDNISISFQKKYINGSSVKNDCTILSKQDDSHNAYVNQYGGDYANSISASDFFNMDAFTPVTISGAAKCYSIDKTSVQEVTSKSYNTTLSHLRIKPATVYNASTGKYNSYVLPGYIVFEYNGDSNYSSVEFDGYVSITFQNIGDSNNVFNITCTDYAINGSSSYINVQESYNNRKSNPTFIPGEVYNFFIHFVDKYGHCTNGYRIINNVVWTTEDGDTDICPISFDYANKTYFASIPVDTNVLLGESINTTDLKIYTSASNNMLIGETTTSELKDAFVKFFSSFKNSKKYSTLKWYQVASGYGLNSFLPYYNNNNEKLFRFPLATLGYASSYGYNISVGNVKIPKGYIGYFISYEKYEPIQRVTGLLTRNDFRSQDYIDGTALYTANSKKSDLMYFYCGQYDIADTIKLDYNIMRIDGVNMWDELDIPDWDYYQRSNNYKFCYDLNKPQVNDSNTCPSVYAPSEYKIVVADSAKDNRMGLGTALQMKDAYGLFPVYDFGRRANNKIKLYKVTFLNASRDIYMSNNKTLIRCSNVMYADEGSVPEQKIYTCYQRDIFPNGYMTYDGHIIYENAGFNFNTGDNIIYRTAYNTKYYPSEVSEQHSWQSNCPPLAYVQTSCFDDHFYEAKCFKNEPTGYAFYVKQDKDNLDKANENNKFQMGCIVTPANSIDLFENRQGSSDDFYSKSYTNYRNDLVSVDEFEKTIRRSTIIQDETRANGWRTFPVEAYKNITENKGIITNLVGIGTMLLVHTEHSLFAFDTNNMLTTVDKTVQLSQPDAFEVNYKEVFTSALGYGGLQDDKSYIVDQFGYMFYNNDFHRFYNFDSNQLNTIDDDIIQWLDKYKPYNIRFANDKFNNRVLIRMNYKVNNVEKDVVISYNYNTKHFVSLHSYYFDEAYNTKSKLYLQCYSKVHTNCSFHQFVQDGSSYGAFDNVKDTMQQFTVYPAKLGFIINQQYDEIKFLEYITYKLNKLANPTEFDYTNSPVEEMVTPYSADLLRAYNNEVNTGELDILIDKEQAKNSFCNYTKPYWELGDWNYNYFRNNIAKASAYGDAYIMSRIFGNYFIIEFTFSNADKLKVEFEELKYGITK